MELQARQNKFGESLRMSASAATIRDPILDEDEGDWVEMKILEGWSHGYLQMMALLPNSVKAIDLHADWIIKAFEKHDAKIVQDLTPPIIIPTATLTSSTPPLSSSYPAKSTILLSGAKSSGAASESDDNKEDEEMLSFTPRKRNGTLSRSASPCPVTSNASPRRPTSISSSDEAASSSLPQTPENHSSPPFGFDKSDSALPPIDHLQPLSFSPKSKPLVTPHHHALREELLSNSLLFPPNNSISSESSSVPPSSPPRTSDEFVSAPTTVKSTRSSSFDTASTANSNFVDAKELLRRRRADAVYGISGANSAVVSDEE